VNQGKTYEYPDHNDSITSALVDSQQPYEGYWKESEDKVIALMKSYMTKLPKENKVLLDAGCGGGRMLVEFQNEYAKGIGIEPDVSRLAVAKKKVEVNQLAEKVSLLNVGIEQVELSHKVDMILCSHVLQHVTTTAVDEILNTFRDVMDEDGLLFITSCHSKEKQDTYSKSRLEERKLVEEYIDEQEFNSLVTNSNHTLPAHFFTKRSIKERLEAAGFEMVEFLVYHILDEVEGLEHPIERDEFVNQSSRLQESKGRDFFVAASPRK
jgi:cyclopropane fatty-acyl-phospholipid synthase-like methyltransferase